MNEDRARTLPADTYSRHDTIIQTVGCPGGLIPTPTLSPTSILAQTLTLLTATLKENTKQNGQGRKET